MTFELSSRPNKGLTPTDRTCHVPGLVRGRLAQRLGRAAPGTPAGYAQSVMYLSQI